MTATPLAKVVHQLRSAALAQAVTCATDADLLRAFLRARDEQAFESLVLRHGPMVLGVCRRVLHNVHDAEEAFQATFLVLVRRASAIQPQSMVGNWLYGVAHRTAMRARKNIARRREMERAAVPVTSSEADDSTDLAELLDQEVARLPDKVRAALLMCDMQGRTRREAAQELGLPEGTVASRVARGRVILARRLVRRGITLSAASVAVSISQQAIASVPASLVTATVMAAMGKAAVTATVASLTQGVIRTMLLSKLRNVLGVVVAMGLALFGLGQHGGNGGALAQPEPTNPPARQAKAEPEPKPSRVKVQVELEAVDAAGRTLTAVDVTGMPLSGELQMELQLDGKKGAGLTIHIGKLTLEPKRAKLSNLPIAKDARIIDDGKDAKLSDLKPGRAELELAVGSRGLQVVGIRIEARNEKK